MRTAGDLSAGPLRLTKERESYPGLFSSGHPGRQQRQQELAPGSTRTSEVICRAPLLPALPLGKGSKEKLELKCIN